MSLTSTRCQISLDIGAGVPKKQTPKEKQKQKQKQKQKPVTQTIQPTLDVPTTDATPEDRTSTLLLHWNQEPDIFTLAPASSFEQVKTAPPRPQHPHPSDEPCESRHPRSLDAHFELTPAQTHPRNEARTKSSRLSIMSFRRTTPFLIA